MNTTAVLGYFGAAVRHRRKELGMTMEQVASSISMSRTYLNEVELGRRNLSLENIDKLARALDISLSGLFALPPFSKDQAH